MLIRGEFPVAMLHYFTSLLLVVVVVAVSAGQMTARPVSLGLGSGKIYWLIGIVDFGRSLGNYVTPISDIHNHNINQIVNYIMR
jgi:hypothetical protein